jgi:hypothetical protein
MAHRIFDGLMIKNYWLSPGPGKSWLKDREH